MEEEKTCAMIRLLPAKKLKGDKSDKQQKMGRVLKHIVRFSTEDAKIVPTRQYHFRLP